MNVWVKRRRCAVMAGLLCGFVLCGCTPKIPQQFETSDVLESTVTDGTTEPESPEGASFEEEIDSFCSETDAVTDETESDTDTALEFTTAEDTAEPSDTHDTTEQTETDGTTTVEETTTEKITTEETTTEETTTEETTQAPNVTMGGGYTVDEVVTYFQEVVHYSEYSYGSGRADVVHKWEKPIYCQLNGNYTEEDRRTVQEIFYKLNQIEGFPGIYFSPDEQTTTVQIYFYDEATMLQEFGHLINYEAADGLMTYWYSNSTNAIVQADVCCRSDVPQTLRNSVIVEEIFNMLGMPNDTETRTDSILYQYGSSVTEPSELDWLLTRLLYDARMLCGYDREQSRDVIRILCDEWNRSKGVERN